MSAKDNTVAVNIALQIKMIVGELQKDLPQDVLEGFDEYFHCLLLFLSSKMSTSDVDAVFSICGGLDDKMLKYERNPGVNKYLARALVDRLKEMRLRPRDIEIGDPIQASTLVSGDEFLFGGSEAPISLESVPTMAIKPVGRFMLVSGQFTRAVGLVDSSCPGEIVEFVSTLTTVRKVIRQTP